MSLLCGFGLSVRRPRSKPTANLRAVAQHDAADHSRGPAPGPLLRGRLSTSHLESNDSRRCTRRQDFVGLFRRNEAVECELGGVEPGTASPGRHPRQESRRARSSQAPARVAPGACSRRKSPAVCRLMSSALRNPLLGSIRRPRTCARANSKCVQPQGTRARRADVDQCWVYCPTRSELGERRTCSRNCRTHRRRRLCIDLQSRSTRSWIRSR